MSFTRQSNHQQSKRRGSVSISTNSKQHKTANMVIQVLWLALESEDKERALDPGIQKTQPGSPRMEEEPGLPSRGRHYGHLREHVNFTLLKNRTALRQHTSANIVIQILRLAKCTKPLPKRHAQKARSKRVWPLVPSGSMGVPCRNSHASPPAAATNTARMGPVPTPVQAPNAALIKPAPAPVSAPGAGRIGPLPPRSLLPAQPL